MRHQTIRGGIVEPTFDLPPIKTTLKRKEFEALYLIHSYQQGRPKADGARRARERLLDIASPCFFEVASSLEERGLIERVTETQGKFNPPFDSVPANPQVRSLTPEAAYQVTSVGYEALEPHRVHNAVLLAAGFSSRFAPFSYETPKGLLTVHGEILIERQIRQLKAAGIKEIVIALGYLRERFYYLKNKFEDITLIYNPHYATLNTHATISAVREHISNSYICSSDNYFPENPFDDYIYNAYYSVLYVSGNSDEIWCTTNDEGIIDRTGTSDKARNLWVTMGHVYWDADFTRRFLGVLDRELGKPETAGKLWEDLWGEYLDILHLEAHAYPSDKILEFDSLKDLMNFDPDFIVNTDSKAFEHLCEVMQCTRQQIKEIKPIKAGLTNYTFVFELDGKTYTYRHPGPGTNHIDRAREAAVNQVALEEGIDDSLIYISPDEGYKVSHFIETTEDFDIQLVSHRTAFLQLLKDLRDIDPQKIEDITPYQLCEMVDDYEAGLVQLGMTTNPDFLKMKACADEASAHLKSFENKLVLCHHDLYGPNLLVAGDKLVVIDWEYAGLDVPEIDLAGYVTQTRLSDEFVEQFIDEYLTVMGEENTALQKSKVYAALVVTAYYWFVWSCYQDSIGSPLGEFQMMVYEAFWQHYRKFEEVLAQVKSA